MMTNFTRIGAALLAVGICAWSTGARAQGTTTESVTTSNGAFTEFGPNSETVVIRSETNPAPLRYVVTKQTTFVDEAGAAVAVDKISAGSQMSVQYTGTGDRLVASRIVVRNPPVTTVPVTTAPVTTVPVATERQSATTTTTTTRSLTDDERDAAKDRREDRKERQEDAIDKQKDRLEEAADEEEERLDDLKDKIDDDDE